MSVNDPQRSPQDGPVEPISDQIATIVARVRLGMVKISDGKRSAGAGSVIHASGLIVTNSHVVQSRDIHVQIGSDRVVRGHLIGRDSSTDLAAIMVEEDDLEVIQMGDSSQIRPGEVVFSLGYPWGIDGGLTFGVVIQLGPWPIGTSSDRDNLLSASLHLRPGHSGGPMFNSRGEIVGLNTMMQGPDVGVAIPINRAKSFLKEALVQQA